MNLLVWTANILGWPLIHLCGACLAQRAPDRYFAHDSWITSPRAWERNGQLYRTALHITRWKSVMPDGASWIGGFSKKKISSHRRPYLQRFLLETRRAEIAHWYMLLAAPVFFLWNPDWACWVMMAYAIVANLPCILVQRYNRFSLMRIENRRSPVRGQAAVIPIGESSL